LASVNWWAVLVAAVASFLVGGIWYGALFSKAWPRLHKFTPEEIESLRNQQLRGFLIFLISDLVLTTVVAGLTAALELDTALAGALLGFWLWLGLAATQTLTLNAASGKPAGLFWMDTSKQLVSLLVIGAIIGAWR